MRLWLLIILSCLCASAKAQSDVFQKSNIKVRGLAKSMRWKSDMVRMVDDMLVYGENRGIHWYGLDEDNKIMRDTFITDYNHDTVRYAYNYDHEGHLLAMRSDKEPVQIQYTYDGDNLMHMSSVDKQGDVIVDVSYTYFKDSTVRKQRYKHLSITTSINSFFYDDKHEHITVIHSNDSSGNVLSSTLLEYDMFDNPSKQTVYNDKGEIEYEYTYEYVYDEHHNFLKRAEYRNGRPFSITKREIVYR